MGGSQDATFASQSPAMYKLDSANWCLSMESSRSGPFIDHPSILILTKPEGDVEASKRILVIVA
jgi:hypothetical protein